MSRETQDPAQDTLRKRLRRLRHDDEPYSGFLSMMGNGGNKEAKSDKCT